MMKLFINNVPVSEGDIITDFRGDGWRFIKVTGQNKIYVRNLTTNQGREFFATVFQGVVAER